MAVVTDAVEVRLTEIRGFKGLHIHIGRMYIPAGGLGVSQMACRQLKKRVTQGSDQPVTMVTRTALEMESRSDLPQISAQLKANV